MQNIAHHCHLTGVAVTGTSETAHVGAVDTDDIKPGDGTSMMADKLLETRKL